MILRWFIPSLATALLPGCTVRSPPQSRTPTHTEESSQNAPDWWRQDVPFVLPRGERAPQEWYQEQLRESAHIVEKFADEHGWRDKLDVYWRDGVEIFATQRELWARILELSSMPATTPPPTAGLSAALEHRRLLAISPEEYARVRPLYADVEGSYARLLAHEIAHRLHVEVLGGDEDAMGPMWFFEGFAVVASGDLLGMEVASAENVWSFTEARGEGAYAKFAAALRYFSQHCAPLPELVNNAKRADFTEWLGARCRDRSDDRGDDRGDVD